jgi:serine/threonine protein phosphatase PrpC
VTDDLPDAVLQRWSGLVAEDARADPFSPSELERVRERAQGGQQAQDTLRAYGATLLGLALNAGSLVWFQLGDGDIAAVSAAGEVRQPLPPDAQSFSNVTHSLCDLDPLKAWRSGVEDLGSETDFVLLASDGYSGAFEDRQAFLSTVGALAAVVREHGADRLLPTLRQSLRKAQQFTGDDATIAVVYRAPGPRA